MEGAGGAPTEAQLWIEGVRIAAGTMSVGQPNWNINWEPVPR